MPAYHVTVSHALDQTTARARVDGFLESVQRDLPTHVSDVSGAWEGNRLNYRLSVSGLGISGTLAVEENRVEVSGPLPLAAMFFRGQIERTIHDDLTRLLS
jgi:hypothetical protein